MSELLSIFKTSPHTHGIVDDKMIQNSLATILRGVFIRLGSRGPGFYAIICNGKEITSGALKYATEISDEEKRIARSAIDSTIHSINQNGKMYEIKRCGRTTALSVAGTYRNLTAIYYDAALNGTQSRCGAVITASALYLLSEAWFNTDNELRNNISAIITDETIPEIKTGKILSDFEQFLKREKFFSKTSPR